MKVYVGFLGVLINLEPGSIYCRSLLVPGYGLPFGMLLILKLKHTE